MDKDRQDGALRETGGEGWKVGKYGGKLGIALRGGESRSDRRFIDNEMSG